MKKTIVVVEDEPIIARDIKNILENEGYEVIVYISTFEAAIIAIEAHSPVLVLLDISLKSQKNGIDIGTYLIQKKTIPFLYITSHSDNETFAKALETKPNGFIVKPFKAVDIRTTVAMVINNFYNNQKIVIDSEDSQSEMISFKIKKVVAFINNNLYEKIEIQQLADLTTWKLHHFIRIFSKEVGETPYQYIISRKIETAKNKIQNSDQALNQISFDLGFKSYSNFCNMFKKVTNKTPEEFKKQFS